MQVMQLLLIKWRWGYEVKGMAMMVEKKSTLVPFVKCTVIDPQVI